jgi:hypothetical protein
MVWIIGAVLGLSFFIIFKLLQLQKNNNLVFLEVGSGNNFNNENIPEVNPHKEGTESFLDSCCNICCDCACEGLSESLCNDCCSCCDC